MNLKEKIEKDFIEAYKAKDEDKTSVLRMVKSAIKNKEIEKGETLSDNETESVVAKEIKQRRDSASEYKKGGRDDLVKKEEKEISILSGYLPEQLSEEEISKIVEKAVADSNASGIKDMGKVMGIIMPEIKGKADGSLVSELVKNKLNKE